MRLNKYKLNEDFDILAIWYKEDQEIKNGIKGVLHYRNHSITLELFDSFDDGFKYESQHLNRIYGFSQDGKLLALNGCDKTHGKESFPGFGIDSYSVNDFYMFEVDLNKQ